VIQVKKSKEWEETKKNFDENCKEIKRMGKNKKEVRSAAGFSFTVKDGSWLITYDKNCKEQNRRSG